MVLIRLIGTEACLELHYLQPALVAQWDAHPIGDQVVTGRSPLGLATFFHGNFLSLPLADSTRAVTVVSFW